MSRDPQPSQMPTVIRCPQCGHTRGSDHDCDNVFHASPAMQEERIETLIAELENAGRGCGHAFGHGVVSVQENARVDAASAALLKYVEDLQEDAELQRHWQKIANGNYEDALRQITSLRASQITPEEARAQIEGMHHLPDPRYHTWLMGRNKLRDIAGMGPQPHEVPPHMPG